MIGLNFFVNHIFVFYVLCTSDHFGRKGSRSEGVRRLDGTCRPESGALPTAVEASPEIAGPIFFSSSYSILKKSSLQYQ